VLGQQQVRLLRQSTSSERTPDAQLVDAALTELQRVKVSSLRSGGSPPLERDRPSAPRATDGSRGSLPPILVHRLTMQVSDGLHRVEVAICHDVDEVDAYLFDGPSESLFDGQSESVFVLALNANITLGLPLTVGERRSAATKIIQLHPEWSDRAIASAAGLSADTVRGIRCATGEDAQLHKRVGKDGRVRPVNAAAERQLAAKLLDEHPDASLREIASRAGISPGTVRDVLARLGRGDDPVPTPTDTETHIPLPSRHTASIGGRGKPATSARSPT
jgi:hypothetical protein